MTKQLTTLDQIKKGWERGYSAELSLNGNLIGNIIDVGSSDDETRVILREYYWFNRFNQLNKDTVVDFQITGWLFAGQLAGNTIEEGDMFTTGGKFPIIGKALDHGSMHITLGWRDISLLPNECNYPKSALEPYFKN